MNISTGFCEVDVDDLVNVDTALSDLTAEYEIDRFLNPLQTEDFEKIWMRLLQGLLAQEMI